MSHLAFVSLLIFSATISHGALGPTGNGGPFSFSADKASSGLNLFFSADQAEREFRPHAAAGLRNQLILQCENDALSGGKAQTSFLCALARREAHERSFFVALPLSGWLFPQPSLPWPNLSELTFSERIAWEARAFLSGSLRGDQNIGKGFLAIESLNRLFPSFTNGRWWKYEAAMSTRERTRLASAVASLNTLGVSEHEASRQARARLDGLTFGVAPQIGYRSFSGFFAGVRVWDDRLSDEDRSVALMATAFSNSTLLGNARYCDRVVVAPLFIESEFGGGWDRRRFLNSQSDDVTYFRQSLASVRLGIGYEMAPFLTARTGVRVSAKGDERPDGGTGLVAQSGYGTLGPDLSLVWDLRDSAVIPRHGLYVGVVAGRSYLDGTSSYWDLRGRIEAYSSLSRRVSWNTILAASVFVGNSRRDLLPVWGEQNLWLPGVAHERYRAQRGLGASTEIQSELAEGIRGLVFATAIALGDPQVRQDAFLWGGGVGAEVSFTRKTRPTFRFELGWLSQELSIRTEWKVAI